MLIEQTKSRPQETLEPKLKKQTEIFSFSAPINLSEERKRLLAVTDFEGTSFVFNGVDKNNTFSISTPGHWSSRGGAKTINRLENC